MTDHTLRTRRIPLDQLSPYRRNPRRGNVDAIAASLAQVGQYKPIVVNAGTHTGRRLEVLAGNHTLAAARQLGWRSLACVTVDVDEEAAARIVAADNRTADLGSYDDSDLLALLSSLPDLAGTGYSESDLAELVAATSSPVSLTDPDDAPTLDETPAVATVGDVWALGPHRLAVGDCTDAAVVGPIIDGGQADCMWTDPPYGVRYVGGNHAKTSKERRAAGGMEIARDSEADLGALLPGFLDVAAGVLRSGSPAYVAHPAGVLSLVFGQALVDAGWRLRQQLIWVKDSMVLGHNDYHYRHEPVWEAYSPGGEGRRGRGGDAGGWYGDHSQTSVFEVPRPKRSAEHPTMKPVELIEPMLRNSCPPGGMVLDPFAGSGSTLIACHQTGRVALLVELDPRYADVICRRWQTHTGDMPTRDGQPVDFLEEG